MVILEKMKNFKVKKEKILNSKDFVVLALLSSTYFLSVINAERFPQRGQVGNKITKKQSLEGVPEQGSRACNCFVPHGRRRLIGILCLCGHQLHSLLTRSLNVLKSTTAATCGGSFSGASKPILQANIEYSIIWRIFKNLANAATISPTSGQKKSKKLLHLHHIYNSAGPHAGRRR